MQDLTFIVCVSIFFFMGIVGFVAMIIIEREGSRKVRGYAHGEGEGES